MSPADICYEETLSTLRYAERYCFVFVHGSEKNKETQISRSIYKCVLFTSIRAKKIKNRAVINASPTERLIKELKAENNKLLSRLAGLGSSGKKVEQETSKMEICDIISVMYYKCNQCVLYYLGITEELRRLFAENELRIQAMQSAWEHQLQEARKEWEQQFAAITQVNGQYFMSLQNICN